MSTRVSESLLTEFEGLDARLNIVESKISEVRSSNFRIELEPLKTEVQDIRRQLCELQDSANRAKAVINSDSQHGELQSAKVAVAKLLEINQDKITKSKTTSAGKLIGWELELENKINAISQRAYNVLQLIEEYIQNQDTHKHHSELPRSKSDRKRSTRKRSPTRFNGPHERLKTTNDTQNMINAANNKTRQETNNTSNHAPAGNDEARSDHKKTLGLLIDSNYALYEMAEISPNINQLRVRLSRNFTIGGRFYARPKSVICMILAPFLLGALGYPALYVMESILPVIGQIKLDARDIKQIGVFVLIGFALGVALSIFMRCLFVNKEKVESALINEELLTLHNKNDSLKEELANQISTEFLIVQDQGGDHAKKSLIMDAFRELKAEKLGTTESLGDGDSKTEVPEKKMKKDEPLLESKFMILGIALESVTGVSQCPPRISD